MKVAISTTIFPMPQLYLVDFFISLTKQSVSNFDIVILNDGFGSLLPIELEYPNLNIINLPYKGTIAKNREYAINYIKRNGYDVIIFADSDDYFSPNRVAKSLELLEYSDIVVNDVTLFNEQGIYCENYISNRISNRDVITLEQIRDKNLLGLSNSALKMSIFEDVFFDSELIAVDWFLFSTILLDKEIKAVFTNETQTYYRQYSSNTVGLGEVTVSSFEHGLKVKIQHYRLMADKDESYWILLQRTIELNEINVDKCSLNKLNQSIKYPLWWENIKFIR